MVTTAPVPPDVSQKTYSVTTRGGILPLSPSFKINYMLRPGVSSASIWNVATLFSLTIFSSASGTGKTSFLNHLYNRLKRRGPFALPVEPNVVDSLLSNTRKVLGKSISNQPTVPALTFDFSPNFEPNVFSSAGYVPQHAPKIQHWSVGELLPESSLFLKCFFPGESQADLAAKRIGEFSGGQRSKIYACSALERLKSDSASCAFLLLDETFDGLGAEEAGKCLHRIRDEWINCVGTPLHMLLVTHLSEKELLNDRTIESQTLALSVTSNTERGLIVEVFNR